MYAQHGAKLHLLAHFARYAFHTDGVAGSDTVLLSPGLDYGVHHSSRAEDKPQLYGSGQHTVNAGFRGCDEEWMQLRGVPCLVLEARRQKRARSRRVGLVLSVSCAGYCRAVLRRRKPTPANPQASIARLAGSGAVVGGDGVIGTPATDTPSSASPESN